MKVEQIVWSNNQWKGVEEISEFNPQLGLLFGSREQIEETLKYVKDLKEKFPKIVVVTCSTAGNILGDELLDEVIVGNLIQLDYTQIETRLIKYGHAEGFDLGVKLANSIDVNNTAYSLVLTTTGINADSLLKGFNSVVCGKVPLSGGIAGDDFKFEKTLVGIDEDIEEGQMVLVSFIGDRLHTYHGSKGGWDTFGPERIITKSNGNILYEIDGKPALQLYKDYLGEMSSELPTSALHFPFAIIDSSTSEYIVRGVQNIDSEANSLILYGDVATGDTIQLMKSNFDRVIQGAEDSALQSRYDVYGNPDFSILISCVARRLVLDQLVEEELSEAKVVLGSETPISGFYSYSELSPVVGENACHLHNQTMTITSFYER